MLKQTNRKVMNWPNNCQTISTDALHYSRINLNGWLWLRCCTEKLDKFLPFCGDIFYTAMQSVAG